MIRFFLLNMLFMMGSSLFADVQKPDWVEKLPIASDYYIGIGISAKKMNRDEYIKRANNNALNNLAAQIKINISSEFIERLISNSGVIKQDIVSQIRTSTKEELEGYELVDTWENKTEYWVYIRLSKSYYQKQKKLKLEKATTLSLDFFSKAKKSEEEMNFDKAIIFYFQAMIPIEKYVDEPLKVNYGKTDIFLMNEILFSVQNLISSIRLEPLENQFNAKVGQPILKPSEIIVTYNSSSGHQRAVAHLPIRFQFLKGSGEYTTEVKTDLKGVAKCQITKITSKKKLQIIQAELNIKSLLNYNENSIVIQGILKSIPVPTTKVFINVSGLPVYLMSSELLYGEKLKISFIEPIIKRRLSDEGFIFTDDLSNAYLIITLNAESRKGAKITGMNMVTSFIDLTVSVTDNMSNEIYKNLLNNVKGVGRDYNAAGLKAFEKAGTKLNEEIMIDMIKSIQQ